MQKKIKSVVFLSNFFNHHQKPISDVMYKLLGDGYKFIETQKMSDERLTLGWGIENYPPYVISSQNVSIENDKITDLIMNADVAIIGSAPDEFVKQRLKENRVTFRYSERIYKLEPKWYTMPLRTIRNFFKHKRHKNLYLLSASAYAASDYARTGVFVNKAFKWGYFPECVRYDNVENVISYKKKNSILWCGRFIDWKHPEYAVELAKTLKDKGYAFEINMIGVGEMLTSIKKMIKDLDLSNNIHLLGAMKPEEVRLYMEKSEIFIMTSNRQEGWGAVLNEAMNSACAVVVNNAVGSAPYLVKNNENGLLYYCDENSKELCKCVESLLACDEKRIKLSKNAYETIVKEWNAEKAVENLLELFGRIINKGEITALEGPCSRA